MASFSLLDLATLATAAEHQNHLVEESPRAAQEQARANEHAEEESTTKLTDFHDDILHHIFAYASTMQDLRSFAYVNKRAHQWVFQSPATDSLFASLYKQAFGHTRVDGRNAWRDLFRLKQILASGINQTNPFQLNNLGVLPPERETEAVGYDHPIHFRAGQCLGYFGIGRIFPEGDGPLAIWGDYDGLCVVPSLTEILPHQQTKHFSKIPGDSQVLDFLASPLSYDADTNTTTFFLGYASGKVQAVKATRSNDGRHAFEPTSSAAAHTDEVTTLTVLPLNPPCVASSSVDGSVMVYPGSMSRTPTLLNAVLACRSREKILTMTATKWGGDSVLLCTGDDKGRLTLWSQQRMPASDQLSLSWRGMSSRMVTDEFVSLPTQMQFLHDTSDTLIVGTNSGGLYIFSVRQQQAVVLHRIADVSRAHVGAVDSLCIHGNVVLTSGGYEGHVIGWDTQTLMPIGSVAVHPGRLYPPIQAGRVQVLLKCAVITTIVWPERHSLVSLCRDGTVQEYYFGEDEDVEEVNETLVSEDVTTGPYAEEDDAKLAPEEVQNGTEAAVEECDTKPAPNVAKSHATVESNVKESDTKPVPNVAKRPPPLDTDEPLPISSLQQVMSNADESLRGRMQVRIIQAGVQKRNDPESPFTGADNLKYLNTKMAFDLFSGLSQCEACRKIKAGPFECRIKGGHENVQDESRVSLLFQRMRNTKNAWITDGEETWTCGAPCHVDNKVGKKRCFLCQKWKDGRHPISKPRAKSRTPFYSASESRNEAQMTAAADLLAAKLESSATRDGDEDSDDEVRRVSMTQRVMQCALERHSSLTPKKSPRKSPRKPRGQTEQTVEREVIEAFDKHSDLSPCGACLAENQGAFVCRVQRGHENDMDTSLPSVLFQRLSKSKRAWIEDDEPSWRCERCKVQNQQKKRRCFVCQGWVGGTHAFTRKSDKTGPQQDKTEAAADESDNDDPADYDHDISLAVVSMEEPGSEEHVDRVDGRTASLEVQPVAKASIKVEPEVGKVNEEATPRPKSAKRRKRSPVTGEKMLVAYSGPQLSLDDLRQAFELNDATLNGRMQMSIIQSACERKLTPDATFLGADGNVYANIGAAFDTFSGIFACNDCKANGEGAFTCRLTLGHVEGMGDTLPSAVFLRMCDNRKAWIQPGEPVWTCPQCKIDNKMAKSRCFLCNRRKDGKRIDEISNGDGSVSAAAAAAGIAPAALTEGATPKTAKVWECYVCFQLNHWSKWSCGGCGRRAGGRTMEIPWESPSMDDGANGSSSSPGQSTPKVPASPSSGEDRPRKRKSSNS